VPYDHLEAAGGSGSHVTTTYTGPIAFRRYLDGEVVRRSRIDPDDDVYRF